MSLRPKSRAEVLHPGPCPTDEDGCSPSSDQPPNATAGGIEPPPAQAPALPALPDPNLDPPIILLGPRRSGRRSSLVVDQTFFSPPSQPQVDAWVAAPTGEFRLPSDFVPDLDGERGRFALCRWAEMETSTPSGFLRAVTPGVRRCVQGWRLPHQGAFSPAGHHTDAQSQTARLPARAPLLRVWRRGSPASASGRCPGEPPWAAPAPDPWPSHLHVTRPAARWKRRRVTRPREPRRRAVLDPGPGDAGARASTPGRTRMPRSCPGMRRAERRG